MVQPSERGLFLVGAGAALAGLTFAHWVQVLGAVLLAVGVWLLRPADDPPLNKQLGAATLVLVLWTVLLATGYPALSLPLLLAATVLVTGAMRRIAQLNAWSYATSAWKIAFGVGVVVYGVLVLLAGVAALTGGSGPPDVSSALAVAGAVALPAVFTVRAVARTLSDRAQAQDAEVHPVPRFVASRMGLLALLGFYLIPLWLLAPVAAHFALTPTFAAFTRQHAGAWEPPPLPAGAERVDTGLGRKWQERIAIGFRTGDDDPPFPPGRQSAGHRLRLQLHHGVHQLLEADHEVLATMDMATGELSGARAQVRSLRAAPGFHAACVTRIDMDAPLVGKNKRRVPFAVYVVVMSGPGEPYIRSERVRGLPRGSGASPGDELLDPQFEEGGLLSLIRLGGRPDPDEGWRAVLVVEGQLELDTNGFKNVALSTRQALYANTLEYSLSGQLDQTAIVQYPRRLHEVPRTTTWRLPRRWRGKVW